MRAVFGVLYETPQADEVPGLLLPAGEALADFLPVHHVPPGSDVFGTAVLIFQIVGVLPHVEPEHRVLGRESRYPARRWVLA
jgi:hypothetical protein